MVLRWFSARGTVAGLKKVFIEIIIFFLTLSVVQGNKGSNVYFQGIRYCKTHMNVRLLISQLLSEDSNLDWYRVAPVY